MLLICRWVMPWPVMVPRLIGCLPRAVIMFGMPLMMRLVLLLIVHLCAALGRNRVHLRCCLLVVASLTYEGLSMCSMRMCALVGCGVVTGEDTGVTDVTIGVGGSVVGGAAVRAAVVLLALVFRRLAVEV